MDDLPYHDTLLFYDSAGTLSFYTTDGRWICPVKTHTGFNSPAGTSWAQIVTGNFSGSGFTDLLCYDGAGTLAFYSCGIQGRIRELATYTGWISPAGIPWAQIIPGHFSGSRLAADELRRIPKRDLLCYDEAGTGQFFTTDGQGGIPQVLRTHTGWQASGVKWTRIIPGHFSDSGFSDLLFWEGAGTLSFHRSDGQGGNWPTGTYTGWISPAGIPWTHVRSGDFGRTDFTDLLFYDQAGTGQFFTTDGQGGIPQPLRMHTGWQSSGVKWTRIIPGDFTGSGFTDLLFCDEAGTLSFYASDGQGEIARLGTHIGMQSAPWTRIISGIKI